jgi:hypothetical protein
MIEDTLKERGKSYGEFIDNSTIAQELKDVVRQGKSWDFMEYDMKEAIHMILSKISRLVTGDCSHLDTWEDLQGYPKLVQDRLKANEARPEPNEDDLPREPLSFEEWAEKEGWFESGTLWFNGPDCFYYHSKEGLRELYEEYIKAHAKEDGGVPPGDES